MEFPEKITTFLNKHHVVTIATCQDNRPWCFNAFYVFDSEEVAIYITSHEETKHIQEVLMNPEVSGSVVLETNIVGKVQGLQFSAHMTLCENEDEKRANKLYIKKFPFAAITPKTLWKISFDETKYTDNTLGFGKKLTWTKNS